MNKNIAKYLLALATIALAGGGCSVNDFNDQFDGFEGKPQPGNVQTISKTLSAADYTAISSNKDNLAIAKELGTEAEAALKAIGVNKFIDGDDSKLYLPAFLTSTYGYLDNGSSIEISFVNKNKGSEVLTKGLDGQYALEEADYDTVWGANQTTPFFTPDKPAAEFVPKILKAKKTGAVAGDYSLVTYSYSYTEPSVTAAANAFNAPATRADVVVKKIADINFAGKEQNATAEGIVIGLHAQGVLFQDETGIALFYNGAETFFSLGDKIRVTGNTQVRYGVNQFDKGGKAEYLSHPEAAFTYPAVVADITKDNIASYTDADASKYVSMSGTLVVDGFYMNLTLDGMDPKLYRGSLSYVFPAMDMAGLNGKKITVTGYYLGNSGSSTKNFQLLVTSVKEVGGTDITATGMAATKAGTFTCQGYVVGTYDKGFMLNDGTGNIVVYLNKTPTVEVGALVTVAGDTELRSKLGQFKSTAVVTPTDKTGTVTRAAAMDLNKATIEAYMAAPIYQYASTTATLTKKVSGSNTYYELHDFEGTAIYGNISYPLAAQKTLLDKLANKKVIVSGYLIGINAGVGYFNIMALNIEAKDKYVTETRYGVYTYTGSAWEAVEAKNALTINEADYKEMGLSNMYFDSTNSVDKYVVSFLNKMQPYAQADQLTTLFYNYKEAASDAYAMGGVYKFNGTAWTQNQATEQYGKSGGKWQFNPSPTIVVAPDKSAFSVKFYQACVDYVIAEKNAAYTTKDGTTRLDKSEFYSGCASDYTNLNWRINTLPWYYWKVAEGEEAVKVYEDWSSTDKTKQKASYAAFYKEVEKRFGEVMSAGLSKLYPNATMIPDVDIIYTVQMMLYTQHIANNTGRVTHAFEFKLVGTGQFEYKRMYALEPKFELMNEENFK